MVPPAELVDAARGAGRHDAVHGDDHADRYRGQLPELRHVRHGADRRVDAIDYRPWPVAGLDAADRGGLLPGAGLLHGNPVHDDHDDPHRGAHHDRPGLRPDLVGHRDHRAGRGCADHAAPVP
ncbi:hypothetical protein G6F68_018794 [Rhizopus microsporus]|nr:hypothetical protein G6F68_018794 [Rhizopus microsporus]